MPAWVLALMSSADRCGSLRSWLEVHVFGGLVVPVLVTLHVGLALYLGDWPTL